MARYGSGSVPIATGWKCTNCRRTHRSSIPRSASGNTRARPALTTDTSRPPRNWSAPCPGSSERCNTILSQSDPICFLFADRYVPLIMRGCILLNISQLTPHQFRRLIVSTYVHPPILADLQGQDLHQLRPRRKHPHSQGPSSENHLLPRRPPPSSPCRVNW